MPTREILMSHTVATLRGEIAKANLSAKADKNLFKRAVSQMRKDELIAVMLAPAYKDRFKHIKMNEKGAGKPKKKPRFPAVEEEKELKRIVKQRKSGINPEMAKKRRANIKERLVTITPKKSKPKKEKKDKKNLSFVPPLTVTKADGSVKELKKRDRKKKK